MPNPFPGMNPFLEDPLHWRGVHLRLIAALDAQLNQTLPPRFYQPCGRKSVCRKRGKTLLPGWHCG